MDPFYKIITYNILEVYKLRENCTYALWKPRSLFNLGGTKLGKEKSLLDYTPGTSYSISGTRSSPRRRLVLSSTDPDRPVEVFTFYSSNIFTYSCIV